MTKTETNKVLFVPINICVEKLLESIKLREYEDGNLYEEVGNHSFPIVCLSCYNNIGAEEYGGYIKINSNNTPYREHYCNEESCLLTLIKF